VATGPLDSTQLRMLPRDEEVSCGSDDPPGTGTVSGVTVSAVTGGTAAAGVCADCSFRDCPLLHPDASMQAIRKVVLTVIGTSI